MPARPAGYPADVLSITRMRRHLPPVVFICLLLMVVMLVGFACACLTDHPMQAIEQALSAIPAAPAISEAWSALAVGLVAAALIARLPQASRGRASPELLQRFLF